MISIKEFLLQYVLYVFVIWPFRFLGKLILRYTERTKFRRTERRYLNILGATEDFQTWEATAKNLDKHRGFEKWSLETPSEKYCDAVAITAETAAIRELRQLGNRRAAAEYVRTHLHRKANGLAAPMLYRYYSGTKRFVEEYNKEVCALIDFVATGNQGCEHKCTELFDKTGCRIEVGQLSHYTRSILEFAEKKKDEDFDSSTAQHILTETLNSFGKTALLLSGGASLGMYHTGVIRALWDAKLLPDIIAGSSAGAIIAAIMCIRDDSELSALMEGEGGLAGINFDAFGSSSIKTQLERLVRSGAFMDVRTLMECLRTNCGDLTFLEAYRKTGRALCVSVGAENREGDKSMLLNYVTTPDVVIWSAVSASCAMPGLFTAVQLLKKTSDGGIEPYLEGELWYDGSVACDLPRKELATMFNANYFIVSQTNPHIVPFLRTPPSPLVHKKKSAIGKRIWFALCGETSYWLKKLFRFGLLPRTGAAEVFYLIATQTYQGDITILPIGSVWRAIPDYINLTSNPSEEHMEYVVSNAQRRTWPHINQIRCCSMVELSLVKNIRFLQNESKSQSSAAQ